MESSSVGGCKSTGDATPPAEPDQVLRWQTRADARRAADRQPARARAAPLRGARRPRAARAVPGVDDRGAARRGVRGRPHVRRAGRARRPRAGDAERAGRRDDRAGRALLPGRRGRHRASPWRRPRGRRSRWWWRSSAEVDVAYHGGALEARWTRWRRPGLRGALRRRVRAGARPVGAAPAAALPAAGGGGRRAARLRVRGRERHARRLSLPRLRLRARGGRLPPALHHRGPHRGGHVLECRPRAGRLRIDRRATCTWSCRRAWSWARATWTRRRWRGSRAPASSPAPARSPSAAPRRCPRRW